MAFIVAAYPNWKISGELVNVYLDRPDVHALHRTKFHGAIKDDFSKICKQLREPAKSKDEREEMVQRRLKLKTVFDSICSETSHQLPQRWLHEIGQPDK